MLTQRPAEVDSACGVMYLTGDSGEGVNILVFAPKIKTRVPGDPVRHRRPPPRGRTAIIATESDTVASETLSPP